MNRLIISGVFIVLCITGCRDRVACPTYQSRYILDTEQREAFFAVFDADSLPTYNANAKARRTWYGIVEKKGYLQRKRELETVPMAIVAAPKEKVDTATFEASDFVNTSDSTGAADSVAVAVVDSTRGPSDAMNLSSTNSSSSTDPQYAIVSADTEGEKIFNVEQHLYMMYIGQEIVDRRQRAYEAWKKEEAARAEEQRIKDSTRYARRERFLSIFRPKNKGNDEDTVEEEYDPFLDYGDDEFAIPGEGGAGDTPTESDEPSDGEGDTTPNGAPPPAEEETEEAAAEGGGNRRD